MGLEEEKLGNMWETVSVRLDVYLPKDMAKQAEEIQRTDPDFLSRVVLYGLTRRSIYRHLRERDDEGRQRLIDAGYNPDNPG